MTRVVCTVKPKDDVRTAESLMRTNAVRRLPVVEDDGHLAGIVSLNDLAREKDSPAYPVELEKGPTDDVGASAPTGRSSSRARTGKGCPRRDGP